MSDVPGLKADDLKRPIESAVRTRRPWDHPYRDARKLAYVPEPLQLGFHHIGPTHLPIQRTFIQQDPEPGRTGPVQDLLSYHALSQGSFDVLHAAREEQCSRILLGLHGTWN